MSDSRRLLSLGDLGRTLPGHAERAAARTLERSVQAMETADAAKSGKVVVNFKPSAKMNRAGTIDLPNARTVDLTTSLARKPAQAYVSSADFDVGPAQPFESAIADISCKPLDPSKLDIPHELLERLGNKYNKRILLVAHTLADHDAVGSVLTLGRALKLLGKQVDICIDDEALTTTQQRFTQPGEIKQAKDLLKHSWDLAVVCDVARCAAIGDANQLVKKCKQVSIIDHHPEHHRNDLERRFDARANWIDTEVNAASVQACAIAERMLVGRTLEPAVARHIFEPALGGIGTDTNWGKHRGTNALIAPIFKHVMLRAGISWSELQKKMEFRVPESLTAFIAGKAGIIKVATPGESKRMALLAVNDSGMAQMLAAARQGDPTFSSRDVMHVLKRGLRDYVDKYGMAALLTQEGNGASVLVRSRDNRATQLAGLWGGGGQADAAHTTVHGFGSFDGSVAEVLRKALANGVIDSAR